jgi:hypothetical protein
MARPHLPREIELLLPEDIVREIYRYVPKLPKKQYVSLSLQLQLAKLQRSPKKTAMFMYGLDDFVLE